MSEVVCYAFPQLSLKTWAVRNGFKISTLFKVLSLYNMCNVWNAVLVVKIIDYTLLVCTLNQILFFYRFIDKYTELKSNSELDEGALFEETAKALLKDGITLRRRGAPFVSMFLFSLEITVFVQFLKYICHRECFNSTILWQYLPWNFICIHISARSMNWHFTSLQEWLSIASTKMIKLKETL